MGKSLRINPNYSEEVVGFALEQFLTLLSFPHFRFSIEPFSRAKERWLGADARLHGGIRGFRPFYMQFKRPFAYPDHSTSGVITGRRELGLATTPRALYFDLRRKSDTQRSFQHNVLFRLRGHLQNRDIGDATYVCPLFLDRSTYRISLHLSGLVRWPRVWRREPWEVEDVVVRDGGRRLRFDRTPVFAEHISVPPHETITHASHRYSFTESGDDLCFHSPTALPDGSTDLAKFLNNVSLDFLNGGKKVLFDDADKVLSELISEVFGDEGAKAPYFGSLGGGPIGRWFAWGDYLRNEYQIEQFALVRWQDDSYWL